MMKENISISLTLSLTGDWLVKEGGVGNTERCLGPLTSVSDSGLTYFLRCGFAAANKMVVDIVEKLRKSLCMNKTALEKGDQVEQKPMFGWLARPMFNTNELVLGNCKKSVRCPRPRPYHVGPWARVSTTQARCAIEWEC